MLDYDETLPIDRQRFAEMIAELQENGAKFQIERRNGSLRIILEGAQ